MTNDKFIRILLFGLLFGYCIIGPVVGYFVDKYDLFEQEQHD